MYVSENDNETLYPRSQRDRCLNLTAGDQNVIVIDSIHKYSNAFRS